MLIEVRLSRASARQWHLRLLETLAGKIGVEVRVRWTEAANRISLGESLLFALERTINRIPAGGPASAVAASHFSRYMGNRTKTPDRVLDFCGPLEWRPTPTWFVMFDGDFGETGALDALLAGRPPLVELVDGSTRAVVASARPGTDRGGVILAAFEDCLHRTTTLLLAALGLSVSPGSEFSPRLGAGACRMVASDGGLAEVVHAGSNGAVVEVVGIWSGVVSGMLNPANSGVGAPEWRPHHDKSCHVGSGR